MFAAQPPRRIWRSSTRKDRDSLSSCSTTRESANRPGNDIRWSVATEPVTAMGTGHTLPSGRGAAAPRGVGHATAASPGGTGTGGFGWDRDGPGPGRRVDLVEGVAAGAGAGGGGVV